MLKNYLKIAWRNLSKSKVSALINISGLAVGMAVAILISLWIWDELSWNRSFKNYDTIAQVYSHRSINGEVGTDWSVPRPLEFELRNKYGSSFKRIVMSGHNEQSILSYQQKKISNPGRFMQAEAPDLLSLEMIKGSRDGLKDLSSVLISSSTATALFGKSNPLNKIIRINNLMDVKVNGVYKDLPYNTEFHSVKFIAHWDLANATEKWRAKAINDWTNKSFIMYVQLQSNTSFEAVSARIKDAIHFNMDKEGKKFNIQVFLNPMSRWHLYSEWKNGVNAGGRIQFVWMFGIIGIFVLLLACINFINLSTARSEKRAKEVGVRKSIGSDKKQLIKQFLTESLLVVLIAFLFALLLVTITLPWFNSLAGKQISMVWLNPFFWLASLLFIAFTTLAAGSYPAFYLSSFNPVNVLKGRFQLNQFSTLPRKVLVVLQFSVSVALIIGTLVVYLQIQHARNRPVGYEKDGLLAIQVTSPDLLKKADVLSVELKNSGLALNTALSSSPLTGVWDRTSSGKFEWKGKTADKIRDDWANVSVSHDFGKTVGWKFKDGRDFSRQFKRDSVSEASITKGNIYSVIVNETTAKYMNLRNPVGEIIRYYGYPFKIIGVIKDPIMESPYQSAVPTIYIVDYRDAVRWMFIRLNPRVGVADALSEVKGRFEKLVPSVPFEYQFADQDYEKKFEAEKRIGNLSTVFATLAIFISCLGLLGLTSFMAERRDKEISIRKVLGATVFNLWHLLSVEFLVLVAVACFVAMPIAWYFLSGWLKQYEYRIEISWWVFGVAALMAILITVITVSFQALKVALANPVKSLKTE